MGQWLAKLSLQELGPSYVDTFPVLPTVFFRTCDVEQKPMRIIQAFHLTHFHMILSKVTTTDLTFSLRTCTKTAFNS